MPQNPKEIVEERINFLIEQLLEGIVQRRYLLQKYTKKFNLKDSQFDKDLRVARQEIKDILDIDKDQERAEIKNRYNHLYWKNIKIQDYRECRAVLDSLCKMGGLNEAEKQSIEQSFTFEYKNVSKQFPDETPE